MQKIKALIKNPTSIDIIINTLGNYFNVFFTALFTLILVRILSAADYGVFSVLTSISYVLATVLDFGTTATIYSYLPPLLETRDRLLYKFVKSTFFYQTIFASIVVIILLLVFPALDTHFFKTGAPYLQMVIASISVIMFIWQNFLLNMYFAAKKFLKANIYVNIANVAKAIAIGICFLTGSITITSVMFIFGVFGNLVFFALVLNERKDDIRSLLSAPVDRKDFRFKYAITYFVASQFLNIGLRMDLFLISFFNLIITRPEVGFYAAAQKIILTIITTIVSITQVLSPSFSRITTQKEVRKEIKHGLIYMLIPCALFIGVIITPNIIYELVLTKKFLMSAPIARSLALPYIIYALGSIPMLFLLYTVKKPKVILIAYAAFFVIVTAGCYFLIPQMKLFAPPILFAVAFIVAHIVIVGASLREFKKLPKS